MAPRKPVTTAKKTAVAVKKPVAKKSVTGQGPTAKTAKRKLSDKTINKVVKATPAKKTAKPKAEPKLRVKTKDPKALATAAGEPWVNVLSVELDSENIGNGAFELDWNDIFVAKLVRAGYEGKTDADIVDRWFQTVCKNILAENYEQWAVNQTDGRAVGRRDLGGGKTEVS
jgi:hypothetical protein